MFEESVERSNTGAWHVTNGGGGGVMLKFWYINLSMFDQFIIIVSLSIDRNTTQTNFDEKKTIFTN